MSRDSSRDSHLIVWEGKPWILPGLMVRSFLIAVIAAAVFWLESVLGTAYFGIISIPFVLWTTLGFFLLWLSAILGLLLLRASNTYILRKDGLEIRAGILTSKAYVISPTGFSDLEVIRTVTARILNTGDIIIRTQSERDSQRRLVRVRDPLKAADMIREVLSHPIVKLEEKEPMEQPRD